jgi:hypothetical protein
MTEKIEPNMFVDRPRYLRKTEVAARYARSITSITLLLNHPDATRRMPPASLIVGSTSFWSVDDLDRFDAEQMELSKHRTVVRHGPPFKGKKGRAA